MRPTTQTARVLAATRSTETLSRVSLVLGVVAVAAFFGLGLAGGWWPALSLTAASGAVLLGFPSRRQLARTDQALLGMILGVMVIFCFVVYGAVAAVT